MRKCKLCNKEIKKTNKFCNNSCAASFNNKGRQRTEKSRMKTAESLCKNGFYTRFEQLKKKRPTKQLKNNGGMNFCRYEEAVMKELEKIYGKLKREIVCGVAIDFANKSFLIEFTIDNTAGLSKIIQRFSKINDKRERIAYIPIKVGTGAKRLEKLKNLKVTIMDSMAYKKLTDKFKNSKYTN